MTEKFKAVIFDFGNVLVKWDPLAIFARFFPSVQAAADFMNEVGFMEWNALQDAGRPFHDGVAELSSRFPQYRQAISAYHDQWETSVTGILHESVKIVEKLKRLGYRLFILSNFSLETFPIMQERYRFLELFDEIFLSGQFRLVKPDRRIFQLTLERIDLAPEDCIFIDDSESNILTAAQLGFKPILFRTPALLDKELAMLLGTTYQEEKS